jgi:hypothetical protein
MRLAPVIEKSPTGSARGMSPAAAATLRLRGDIARGTGAGAPAVGFGFGLGGGASDFFAGGLLNNAIGSGSGAVNHRLWAPVVPLQGTGTSCAALSPVLRHEVPVDELVDHSVEVRRAAVLVVEIVRVLPDVERQERLLALRERHFGIGVLTILSAPPSSTSQPQPEPNCETDVADNSFLKLS